MIQFWLEDSVFAGTFFIISVPETLIEKLKESNVDKLTVVSNNAGIYIIMILCILKGLKDYGIGHLL